MRDVLFTVVWNRRIAADMYEMRLEGDTGDIKRPGQFVNLRIDRQFLRRPLSVCFAGAGEMTLLYKAVGMGTRAMAEYLPGRRLSALTGLGNGYDAEKSGAEPLLIGGGSGVAPLYGLCAELVSRGRRVSVALGFASAKDVYYEEKFRELGAETIVATVDGSCGVRGFATDCMPKKYSYTYACGPEPMLRAVFEKSATSGQYSFEERMGCGFGACMGCSCKTVTGYKRICREGPVLEKEEILWPKPM